MNKDLILREKLALQRTVLANQATLLAFIRTAMYFLVAGISINNLLDYRYGHYIQFAFVTISVFLLLVGFANHKIQKKKIAESEIHIGEFKDEYLM
jgi:putative membrane protein